MWLRLTLNPILPKLVSDNRQLPVYWEGAENEKSIFVDLVNSILS